MKVLLAIVGGLLLASAGALGWLGLFNPLEVRERTLGPYAFAYVQEASTASGARVGQVVDQLRQRLEGAGVPTGRPAQVRFPADRGIPDQVGFVADEPVSYEILGAEAFFRLIPHQRWTVVEFPYRNAASLPIGAWRAGRALSALRAARGYPEASTMIILENGALTFLQPVAGG